MPPIIQVSFDSTLWADGLGAGTAPGDNGYDAYSVYLDKDGTTCWAFEYFGAGFARFNLSDGSIVHQDALFGQVGVGTALSTREDATVFWQQDGSGHYYTCQGRLLYKFHIASGPAANLLNGYCVVDATLDLTAALTPAVHFTGGQVVLEDLKVFSSGGVNYVSIISRFGSGQGAWVINADAMTFVGFTVPAAGPGHGFMTFADKNADLWFLFDNFTPNFVDLVKWHPLDGVSGTNLVVTENLISSTTLGFPAACQFAAYISANHSVFLGRAPGGADTGDVTSIDLTAFTRNALHLDDGTFFYTGILDPAMSACDRGTQPSGILAIPGALISDVVQLGGVINFCDPATLLLTSDGGTLVTAFDSFEFNASPVYIVPIPNGTNYNVTAAINAQGGLTPVPLYGVGGPGGGTGTQFSPFSNPQFVEPSGPTTGNIVIVKDTEPSGSGQAFLFTPSYGAPFTLLDGQSNDSGPLAPGTYSVAESPVAEWVTTVSQDPTAIVVTAGVTTTVTFTNTFSPPPPPTPCADPTGCPFTLADAQSALGLRLYDPTHQFWSLPELTAYIVEALRTWNALAAYWRDEFTFPSQQGVVWYDITDTTVAPNTLRPLTVTDQQLMEVMEYHLLEPVTDTFPLTWTGSQQFSVADLQQALQRRRDEVLSVTGCTVIRLLLPAVAGKIPLPNRATELRRVAFIDASGSDLAATPMFQDDIWALQAFRSQFTTDPAGIPDTYVISTEPIRASTAGPTITFQPNVPPGVPGQFEVLVLMSGIELCPTAPTLVTVPDDWTWVLKWGAIADLLGRESNAKDSLRAKYCESRYKQGLALLSLAPALLTVRSDNLPLQIDAVKAADTFRPSWEGGTQGVPDSVVTAGMNLLGLAPPPTATVASLTADVIRNAPVPVLGTDCIMVTRDAYDVILDYAAHLAAFKQGGEEFTRSIPLMEHFMEMAALSSSKLGEMGEFTKILLQRSQLEDALNPRYSTPTPEGDNG